MRGKWLSLAICLVSLMGWAQTAPTPTPPPPPPQSPRQALLEMFFGTTPNHLEKHLPDVARKALQQLDTPGSASLLSGFSLISAEARAGGSNFQTFETGPILLLSETAQAKKKVEISVEQDYLIGDENQIDLSFHTYRNGRLETMPVIPRLTLLMKTEAGIWKLEEIALSLRAPLTDPEYLKSLVKDLKKTQQSSNEGAANWSLRAIIASETKFHAEHSERGYTCSLTELTHVSADESPENRGMAVSEELASGKKDGYLFALTGCDALHYKVVAEPASAAAGQHAFCADESGEIKVSSDGKATTCLSRGKAMSETEFNTD
jgi:hypothetical protein